MDNVLQVVNRLPEHLVSKATLMVPPHAWHMECPNSIALFEHILHEGWVNDPDMVAYYRELTGDHVKPNLNRDSAEPDEMAEIQKLADSLRHYISICNRPQLFHRVAFCVGVVCGTLATVLGVLIGHLIW